MFSCFIRESLFQYWSDIIGVALHIFHFQLFVSERGYYQGITTLQLLLLEAKLGLTERSFFYFYFLFQCNLFNDQFSDRIYREKQQCCEYAK